MKESCIAVFAKTPGLSPVKTRLAEVIGIDKAEDIYKHCIDSVEQVLIDVQGVDICWALAEKEAAAHAFWHNRPFDKMWTGEGDLGDRLYHVFSTLKQRYKFVVVMSTDSPQIQARILNDVVQGKQNVVGPAQDGGYYLFGSSSEIDESIWKSVPYSTKNTREIFLNKLNEPVQEILMLSDLDVVEDAQKVINEMPADKNEAQKKLIERLRRL